MENESAQLGGVRSHLELGGISGKMKISHMNVNFAKLARLTRDECYT